MNFTPSTIIITYMTMFIIGCMLGYGLEVLFRRLCTAKKWVNPGFLVGPWLPLYGSGLVIMFSLTMLFANVFSSDVAIYNPFGNIFGRTLASGATPYDLIIIGCMWISLVLLEFLAGILFVKGFKIRLWDYTNMRGNIMGVICPLFNLFWLIIAVGYYYLLSPIVYLSMQEGAQYMFGTSDGSHVAHFGLILVIGIIYGFFIIDLVKSLNLFHAIRKFTKESTIVKKYEELREEVKRKQATAKAKISEHIPEVFKKRKQDKPKKDNKFVMFIQKLIFIDPSLKDTSGNYDEKGRPISEKKENE